MVLDPVRLLVINSGFKTELQDKRVELVVDIIYHGGSIPPSSIYFKFIMKISFDFDDTLEHEVVQKVAANLIKKGHNVCILTTRYSDPSRYSCPGVTHDDLYSIAAKLEIKEIIFTEFEWKYKSIDKFKINLHIDNNPDEVYDINMNCTARAIAYDDNDPKNLWLTEIHNRI
jgi:hypothetical protein